jgi:hypothetical protein
VIPFRTFCHKNDRFMLFTRLDCLQALFQWMLTAGIMALKEQGHTSLSVGRVVLMSPGWSHMVRHMANLLLCHLMSVCYIQYKYLFRSEYRTKVQVYVCSFFVANLPSFVWNDMSFLCVTSGVICIVQSIAIWFWSMRLPIQIVQWR